MKDGFTLVELIVTVTIIMLVTAAVAMSFTGTNNKARDGRRMTDIERIRTALELYRQQNGYYPLLDTGGTAAVIPSYLQSWPSDPKFYRYVYDVGTSYTYYLYGYMENVGTTTGSYAGTDCCSGTGCTSPLLCNYRTTNP